MAHHLAIAAVAQTVLKLLETHSPRGLDSTPPQFVLHSAAGLEPVPVEGFSVGVWRVAAAPALRRQAAPVHAAVPAAAPTLPLELSLLLTPWAADAQRQLALLGWALRFVEDHRVLPAALLNQALAGEAAPVFGAHETVEMTQEPLGLAEHLALRAQLGPRWPLGLNLTVRTLQLEPGHPGGLG